MKALVTGATGFVGHAVCAELRERDHEVAALVRRPGSEPPGSSAVQGDLVDAAALARVVEGVRPDCVIHLAAEIASQRDASKIAEVNVEGSRRLLAACAAGGRPRFVFASTVVTGVFRNSAGTLSVRVVWRKVSWYEPIPIGAPQGISITVLRSTSPPASVPLREVSSTRRRSSARRTTACLRETSSWSSSR